MYPLLTPILLAAAGAMMLLERRGLPTTLSLAFKGDIKRETRMLAQYGQIVCTILTALLIWRLDRDRGRQVAVTTLAAVIAATTVSTTIKRLLGRVRPGRPNAGNFLGPALKHANYRESFPSNHSAAAFALSGILVQAYPSAAAIFWTLAIICALLRYIMDSHWPSDVLCGVALGYGAAWIVWIYFMQHGYAARLVGL
jgi:membrane-associated phospholipid phosphatase